MPSVAIVILNFNGLHFLKKFLPTVVKYSKDCEIVVADNASDDGSVDLLYLDGNHSYNEVIKDLNAWLPKIKDGGSIIGDDWTWKTVKKAVLDFAELKGLKVNVSEHGITWEIVK